MIEPARIVQHPSGEYPLYTGAGLLDDLAPIVARHAAGPAVVVTSRPVREVLNGRLDFVGEPIIVPDGEAAKTFEIAEEILSEMLERGLRRDAVVIAAGGGTVGDVASFAASVFMRGLRVVHVPTTLLAMVDSTIGGKTAINHERGKNLIGTFWPPVCVIADVDVLASLSVRDLVSGKLEALKAGVIGDPQLFALIERSDRDSLPPIETIERAQAVKAAIVEEDERESGRRRLLNYGHTIGHGLETALDYSTLTHGECVGWGMIAANHIALSLGVIAAEESGRIDDAILRLAPLPPPPTISRSAILDAIDHDKKFRDRKRLMVLPTAIGQCEVFEVERARIESAIEAIL